MNLKTVDYYFEPIKIIRDLVHEYINLTKFDLDIIDTVEFQRLKDIRQLTCQEVYPSARHTRFEHSLGVLELTRRAISNLNRNGFIDDNCKHSGKIIDDNLLFNASIAALLHDVGHCPFSHMGETEFDVEEVRESLYDEISINDSTKDCKELLNRIGKKNSTDIGSVHEQLSCIMILTKFDDLLQKLTEQNCNEGIQIDYELIIRCILGIEYDISDVKLFKQNRLKNSIIRLINSNIFDMDKLDYIMRDSYFTGIGMPRIDTQRLFRNMFFNQNYELVFKSRAIPVLQNMIDSRDGLYMYVYNHHAVVFSDFMNTYISRRLSHNAQLFLKMVYPDKTKEERYQISYDRFNISSIGLIPKPYLFSVDAIIGLNRSDSDWISLLNIINSNYMQDRQLIELEIEGVIEDFLCDSEKPDIPQETISELVDKIKNMFELIAKYKSRQFLKPWWKTIYEFTNFIDQYFRDDKIRKELCWYLCKDGKFGLKASELRSQIAKHVIYITQNVINNSDLLEPLDSGDFFVIERSNRFLNLEAIEKLEIALKTSEIIGTPTNINYKTSEYYIKNLTSIIPQKDYSSIYAKEGFYIFSKPYAGEENDEKLIKKHYTFIEQIFVFVANSFIKAGEQEFVSLFGEDIQDEERKQNEQSSCVKMLNEFKKELNIK